jgi:leucyl-tRNA synthetase
MGPPKQGGDWSDEGVEGVHRFLARLWRLGEEVAERTEPAPAPETAEGEAGELLRKCHWAIDKATRDFDRDFQFNTVISAVMELVNDAYRLKDSLYGDPLGDATVRFAAATASSLIFLFAPHLAAEIYERLTGERVWEQPWPVADPALLSSDVATYVVQVNGKLRDRVEVPAETPEQDVIELARASEKVQRHLDGKEVVKEIFVPGKLVNLVVR